MPLVVADTSPIFYLLSIGHIDLLPRLFGTVLMPDAVHQELCNAADERKATAFALSKGLNVTGTLGVLGLAARRGLIDLADSFARLKRTNFRCRQEIMDEILEQQKD